MPSQACVSIQQQSNGQKYFILQKRVDTGERHPGSSIKKNSQHGLIEQFLLASWGEACAGARGAEPLESLGTISLMPLALWAPFSFICWFQVGGRGGILGPFSIHNDQVSLSLYRRARVLHRHPLKLTGAPYLERLFRVQAVLAHKVEDPMESWQRHV